MGNLKEITDDEFETEVVNADEPVLVDFFATWCPPCQRLLPVLDKLAGEYEGRVLLQAKPKFHQLRAHGQMIIQISHE